MGIFILDSWTKTDQWLTWPELLKITNIKSFTWEAFKLWSILKSLKNNGLLEEKLVHRQGNRGKKYIKAWKPKDWVLNSVCDGFFIKAEKNLVKAK